MSDVESKPEIKTEPEIETKPAAPIRDKSQLFAALAKAQGEFVQPEKNKKTKVHKDGRLLYETKYADLKNVIEAFRGPLSRNGLAFTQKTRETNRGWRLVLTLMHSSGEYDETSMPINLDQGPQQVGSNLTYFKRYQAAAYFGIAADDDDDANGVEGNQAEIADNKSKAKPVPKTPPDAPKPITPAMKSEPKPIAPPPSKPVDAAKPQPLTVKDVATLGAKRGWHADLMNRFMAAQFGKSKAADLTPEELNSMAESIQTMNGFDATTFIEQMEKSKA